MTRAFVRGWAVAVVLAGLMSACSDANDPMAAAGPQSANASGSGGGGGGGGGGTAGPVVFTGSWITQPGTRNLIVQGLNNEDTLVLINQVRLDMTQSGTRIDGVIRRIATCYNTDGSVAIRTRDLGSPNKLNGTVIAPTTGSISFRGGESNLLTTWVLQADTLAGTLTTTNTAAPIVFAK